MNRLLVEVCVEDAAGISAAITGGADRIELCSALELGGLTPTPGLIAFAATVGIPVRAMIRPRSGDFVFSQGDVATMLGDIAAVRNARLAGVVLGASLPDGRLDFDTLSLLVKAAAGMELTLHRAFDLVPNVAEAVEQAVTLGFDTILTSGRAPSAVEGVKDIALAYRCAAGRIAIMAGAGMDTASARAILTHTKVDAFHGSFAAPTAVASAAALRLGFAGPGRKTTRADIVASFKVSLE